MSERFYQPLRFDETRDGDKRVVSLLSADWPNEIAVSNDLLTNADPALLRRDGEHWVFTVANGTARYAVENTFDQFTGLKLIEGVVFALKQDDGEYR